MDLHLPFSNYIEACAVSIVIALFLSADNENFSRSWVCLYSDQEFAGSKVVTLRNE